MMNRFSVLFRKLTPLEVMEADLADAKLNRLTAAKETEYFQSMGRMYDERIERLNAEIAAEHAAAQPQQASDVPYERRVAQHPTPSLVHAETRTTQHSTGSNRYVRQQ